MVESPPDLAVIQPIKDLWDSLGSLELRCGEGAECEGQAQRYRQLPGEQLYSLPLNGISVYNQ